ncbi:hypothetical protein [Streptacidiphilus fuscans]|uniref:Uncharacterized protein n=1 Tax=Streptacidiphilus fuscans TaxID=2789292 RepID=A0A931B7M8_9ACTN|nr:hypothetical protein [Streptacidiphilus fuscans]MBF9071934.1 hypothetical protein [Streptacidiphilus fuscans]
MNTENFTSWTDTKARARAIREAAGTQRTPLEEATALEQLPAKDLTQPLLKAVEAVDLDPTPLP